MLLDISISPTLTFQKHGLHIFEVFMIFGIYTIIKNVDIYLQTMLFLKYLCFLHLEETTQNKFFNLILKNILQNIHISYVTKSTHFSNGVLWEMVW